MLDAGEGAHVHLAFVGASLLEEISHPLYFFKQNHVVNAKFILVLGVLKSPLNLKKIHHENIMKRMAGEESLKRHGVDKASSPNRARMGNGKSAFLLMPGGCGGKPDQPA